MQKLRAGIKAEGIGKATSLKKEKRWTTQVDSPQPEEGIFMALGSWS